MPQVLERAVTFGLSYMKFVQMECGETQIKNAKVDKHTTPHNMHSFKADSGHAHIPKFKSF
jgi:hypothetical protein